MKTKLFLWSQNVLPQHLLSRLLGKLANSKLAFVKNLMIDLVINNYTINMSEAEQENPYQYDSFNAFFTRALKANVRPMPKENEAIVSPADGVVSQLGQIEGDKLLQAKGHYFSLEALLAGDTALASEFMDGQFATVYLAPKDYHRVHMPMAGKLKKMTYVPGALFSVNQTTAEHVPGLFSKNERVICEFETNKGTMILILVGAFFVASMETVWHGIVTAQNGKNPTTWTYEGKEAQSFKRGEEMGRFQFGSTVIAIFPKGSVSLSEDLNAGQSVLMGQKIGTL